MDQPPAWHHLPDNPYNPHAWLVGEPVIGKGTWVGAFCVLDGSGGLQIGENCDISAGAQIYSHSTVRRAVSQGELPVDRAATSVGDHCHIGAGAIILMGCRIGDRCVVGAGSVVKEFTVAEADSLLVGVPARVIRGGARGLHGGLDAGTG